jgi:hypothetical protein
MLVGYQNPEKYNIRLDNNVPNTICFENSIIEKIKVMAGYKFLGGSKKNLVCFNNAPPGRRILKKGCHNVASLSNRKLL